MSEEVRLLELKIIDRKASMASEYSGGGGYRQSDLHFTDRVSLRVKGIRERAIEINRSSKKHACNMGLRSNKPFLTVGSTSLEAPTLFVRSSSSTAIPATMSSPFATYPAPERTFLPANPGARATVTTTPTRGTGAKRGRKPKNANLTTDSTRTSPQNSPTTSLPTPLQWTAIQSNTPGPSTVAYADSSSAAPSNVNQEQNAQLSSETGGVISLPGVVVNASTAGESPSAQGPSVVPGAPGADEDGDGEDELLPAMADDDYSAQLSWQSQSKDNLKYARDPY